MSVNQITQRIHMSNGLSLYKTGRSPYYFVRIWNPVKKKYLTRSTKETTRIDARQVAQESCFLNYILQSLRKHLQTKHLIILQIF